MDKKFLNSSIYDLKKTIIIKLGILINKKKLNSKNYFYHKKD